MTTVRPLRVLVLDDDPVDRLLAVRSLRRAFDDASFVEAGDARSFARALEDGEFDVAVTDYQLGWATGLDALQALKSRYPDRPVVMFSGAGDQELVADAMRAGLDDYAMKSPQAGTRLPLVVQRALDAAASRARAAGAKARLAELMDLLDVGCYRSDARGTLVECNDAYARAVGAGGAAALAGRAVPAELHGSAATAPARRRCRTVTRVDGSNASLAFACLVAEGGGTEGLTIDCGEQDALSDDVLRGLERERERIGAELHDGLGQVLVGLGMLGASFERTLAARAPQLHGAFAPLRQAVRDAQDVCRTIAHGYAAVPLRDGLAAALAALGSAVTEAGLPCTVDADPQLDGRLAPAAALDVYRIAQEACANAMRHARARRLDLTLRAEDRGRTLRLTIADDGAGVFPPGAPHGFGLRTLRYRAARLQGELTIDAQPARGTLVALRAPL